MCEEEEYSVTLSEAAPSQHLLTVRASDADDSRHARLRYYLAGDGADDFTIDPALGQRLGSGGGGVKIGVWKMYVIAVGG